MIAPGGLDAAGLPRGTVVTGDAAQVVASQTGGIVQKSAPLAVGIGRLALAREGADPPRPAPLYLRSADAAPARDRPPVMLE